MSGGEAYGRDELIAALEALPEVEKTEPGEIPLDVRGGTLDIYIEDGDFTPPRVLGTIAAHGWGVVEVSIMPRPVVGAWPRPPREMVPGDGDGSCNGCGKTIDSSDEWCPDCAGTIADEGAEERRRTDHED